MKVHWEDSAARPSGHLPSYDEIKIHSRKRVSINSAKDSDERITGILKHAQHARSTRSTNLLPSSQEAGGLCGRSSVLFSPVVTFSATFSAAFGSLLINTILSWSDQPLQHDLWQVGSLLLMSIAAINTGFVYRRHQRELAAQKLELAEKQVEEEHQKEEDFALAQLAFLGASVRMVTACEGKSFKEIKKIFLEFHIEMDRLKQGVVPPDLKRRWVEVGALLEKPETSEKRALLVQLMENKILPKVELYTQELDERLIALGYSSRDNESGESSSTIVDLSFTEKGEDLPLVPSGSSINYETLN